MQNTMENTVSAHIKANATEISDRELHDQYDDMLDECYSFKGVGGPFEYMTPSRVLRDTDPIAYRCGFVDWLDAESERVVEIDGEYYDRESAEDARDEFLNELETELENARSEEAEDTASRDAEILTLEARLAEAKKFTL